MSSALNSCSMLQRTLIQCCLLQRTLIQCCCVSTHRRFDGIVVAEESEEVLREAWETEEQLLLEKQIKVTVKPPDKGHSEILLRGSNV